MYTLNSCKMWARHPLSNAHAACCCRWMKTFIILHVDAWKERQFIMAPWSNCRIEAAAQTLTDVIDSYVISIIIIIIINTTITTTTCIHNWWHSVKASNAVPVLLMKHDFVFEQSGMRWTTDYLMWFVRQSSPWCNSSFRCLTVKIGTFRSGYTL